MRDKRPDTNPAKAPATGRSGQKGGPSAAADERRRRSAAALKQNLRRRKAAKAGADRSQQD